MTKWQIQKQTHRTTQNHVEHEDATDIQKKNYFGCVFRCLSKNLRAPRQDGLYKNKTVFRFL